jgi:hypothetical protein
VQNCAVVCASGWDRDLACVSWFGTEALLPCAKQLSPHPTITQDTITTCRAPCSAEFKAGHTQVVSGASWRSWLGLCEQQWWGETTQAHTRCIACAQQAHTTQQQGAGSEAFPRGRVTLGGLPRAYGIDHNHATTPQGRAHMRCTVQAPASPHMAGTGLEGAAAYPAASHMSHRRHA